MDDFVKANQDIHNQLYNPMNSIIQKIGMQRAKKVNELIEKNIPSWKQKLLTKFPNFSHKLMSLGYDVKIIPQPLLESDIIREKIVLRHKEKTLAETVFYVQDKRKLGQAQIPIKDETIEYDYNGNRN